MRPSTVLNIHIVERPEGIQAHLSGAIDLAAAGRLSEALAVTRGRPLIVDMAEVTFIDTAAVRALLGSLGVATTVRIVRPSRPVTRLRRLIALYDKFCGDD